jgi:hypothetical protein
VLTEAVLEESPPNEWFFWRRAPGALFHVAVGLLALSLLWVHSEPAVDLLPWLTVVLLSCLLALVWAVRLLTFLLAMTRDRSAGSPLAWPAAPAVGFVVLVLVVAGIPLQARWTISRPAFDAVVEQHLRGGERVPERPGRLGLYEIARADDVDGALLFFEGEDGALGASGFAHLPDGPRPDRLVGSAGPLRFEPRGGPWYSWTTADD